MTILRNIVAGLGDRRYWMTLSPGSLIEPSFLAIGLVLRAGRLDPCLSELLCHAVGVLTMEVQSTVAGVFVACRLGQVNREVPIPVSEGVGVIVD
jgi:hypothetical protein